MKIERQAIDRYLRAPDPAIGAVLVFGPDEGMVHERATAITRAVLGAESDPFRLVELGADALKADPARLDDELRAISMMGGRRVIRIDRAVDALEPLLAATLAAHRDSKEALLLVEAGDIGGRSGLKKLFESARHAAAIACYRDEQADLSGIVTGHLAAAGLAVGGDALAYLVGHLGGDRGITRSELDKLVLYMGTEKKVRLEDAVACIGDRGAIGQDELCAAVGLGNLPDLERELERNFSEAGAIVLLRAVARHFMRLHQVTGRLAQGEGLEEALRSLRPPLFWKSARTFGAQCQRWPAERIGAALLRLSELEAEAMRHHQIADTLARRGLMEVAMLPGRR